MNADFNGSQHWSQELRAGTYDGDHLARAFMQFDVSGLEGRKVTEATLRLRNHYAGSCTAGSLRAYRVTSSWSLTGVTWANQPAVDAADYDDYSPAHGDAGCAEDNAYWVITNMVKSWVEGAAPNYGVRIRAASETALSGHCAKDAREGSNQLMRRADRGLVKPARLATVVSALVLMAGACGGTGPSVSRATHAEGDGPLSASKGTDATLVSIPPPPGHSDEWVGTFGASILCANGEGTVRLNNVRVKGSFRSTAYSFFVRRVGPNSGELTPIGNAYGSPPDFSEPYAEPIDGEYSKVRDQRIRSECGASPRTGFDELLVAVHSGAAGGLISTMYIDYTYRGKRYTLRLNSQLALCGTSSLVTPHC